MASVIQNLLESALGDGARSAKFEVEINFPNKIKLNNKTVTTLVKNTSYPTKSHDIIDFKFKGRSIPLRGQAKYAQTWECTFYLEEDHNIKLALESWMDALEPLHTYIDYEKNNLNNINSLQKDFADSSYTSVIKIAQFNFELDKKMIEYTLKNVFPISISTVDANAESIDTLSEFTVTFAISDFFVEQVEPEKKSKIDSLKDEYMNKMTEKINGYKKTFTGKSETVFSRTEEKTSEKLNSTSVKQIGEIS